MELINNTDEPIEVGPGESIKVDVDVDSRRGLVRRSSVVTVVDDSNGEDSGEVESRQIDCDRCDDFEGTEGEMIVHLIRTHGIKSVIDRRDAIQSMLEDSDEIRA